MDKSVREREVELADPCAVYRTGLTMPLLSFPSETITHVQSLCAAEEEGKCLVLLKFTTEQKV